MTRGPFRTNPLSGQPYPNDYFTVDTVEMLLLLVEHVVPRSRLEAWSPLERYAAGDWALRVHVRASDNLNRVPSKPECVRRDSVPLGEREREQTGTVMDLSPKGAA